jgi:hypothetical protein
VSDYREHEQDIDPTRFPAKRGGPMVCRTCGVMLGAHHGWCPAMSDPEDPLEGRCPECGAFDGQHYDDCPLYDEEDEE